MAKKTEKVNEDAPATAAAATLSTKSAMMSGILQAISGMSHEDMMKWFPDAMALASGTPDASAQNAASISMKPSGASPMQEDVAALFAGEDLNEDAKLKIGTLIEHAVDLQVTLAKEQLQEEYQNKLVEEVAKIQEQLVEKVDSYVTYAAEQWVEKNEVQIESVTRVDKATRLLEGLVALVKEHNLEIPAEQETVVEALEKEVAELKAKLNEQVDEAVAVRQELVAANAKAIFRDVAEGLTLTETEKLKKLVEDIEVDIDPADLRKKLTIIREAHFKGDRTTDTVKEAAKGLTEALDETAVEKAEAEKLNEAAIEDPRIAAYAAAISAGTNRFSTGPYGNAGKGIKAR